MKNNLIVTPIVLIVLAIVLLIIPGNIVTTVIRIFGIVIIVTSALSMIDSIKEKKSNFALVYGILITILGIVFITNPEVIASIIPLILGIWFIIKSAYKLQYVLEMRRNGNNTWVKSLILNLIMLILGIVLIFNPFKGAEALIRIIAIFILVYAILDIVENIMVRPKRIKVIK